MKIPIFYIFIITLILFSILLPQTSAAVIDFSEQYQDYLSQSHKYNSYNILLFPMYQVIDNGNNWTISRQGTIVNLPKQFTRNGITFNVNYQFLPDRIIPSIQIDNYSQINTFAVKVNTTVWYLPFSWSASQVKSVNDDLIDMGVFKRTTLITVLDSNTTPNNYQVIPKVINGDIRFYFNPQTYSNVVYPLTLTENTITVSNATTSGFTSTNVTFDGVRWTDNGQIAINHRNDSQANMSGLVGYWSMDENTGTLVHNVNTESGLINVTNQGTWIGNTTLNYSIGRIGNALSFDGVNDYVDAGNNASLNFGTGDFSIGMWIKRNGGFGSRQFFVDKYIVPGISLEFWTNNKIRWLIYTSEGTFDIYTSSTFLNNNWNYVLVQRNNNTSNIYVNGVIEASISDILGTVSNSRSVVFGRYVNGNTFYFNGSIDEVRIWNRALSAPEIAVLYNTSMRTQGNLIILNQSASTGNVINRTRIVYNGQDSINNASIYARQNGTSNWDLVQSNVTSNTWYSIINQYQNNDFRILLNGNGSNTPFLISLEWDETIPVIDSWYNNYTNDTTLNFNIYSNNLCINFNVTANSSNYSWYINNINQNNNFNNFTYFFNDSIRNYNVTVSVLGISKTWNIYNEYVIPLDDNDVFISNKNYVYRINNGLNIYKIVLLNDVSTGIIINNNNIYYGSNGFLYTSDKRNGTILYKNIFDNNIHIYNLNNLNITKIMR